MPVYCLIPEACVHKQAHALKCVCNNVYLQIWQLQSIHSVLYPQPHLNTCSIHSSRIHTHTHTHTQGHTMCRSGCSRKPDVGQGADGSCMYLFGLATLHCKTVGDLWVAMCSDPINLFRQSNLHHSMSQVKRMMQHCFSVKLQKCFVDYKSIPDLPSVSEWPFFGELIL